MEDKKTQLIPFGELIQLEPEEVYQYISENNELVDSNYSNEEYTSIVQRMMEPIYTESDDRINEIYLQKEGPRMAYLESTMNQTWLVNHSLIMECIEKHLKKSKRIPTIVNISDDTKLSRTTITKHLKYFEKEKYLAVHYQKIRLLTEGILNNLAHLAFNATEEREKIKASSEYLKFADKVFNKVKAKKDEQTNNFIQINNIFIHQDTIKSLPQEDVEIIEEIILKNNKLPFDSQP